MHWTVSDPETARIIGEFAASVEKKKPYAHRWYNKYAVYAQRVIMRYVKQLTSVRIDAISIQ